MARQWLLLACCLGMLAACFNPRYPEGIACSEAQTCPPGQSCDVNGVCRRTLLEPTDPDASVRPDAAVVPDAAAVPPDAPFPGCTRDEECQGDQICGANGTCVDPSCEDDVLNGTETGVDCGGSCPPCADGEPCLVHGDCASQNCEPDGMRCAPAECGDRRVGGNEVCDTGGVNAGSCDSDCTAPACADGIYNQFFEVCDTGGVATEDCDPDCTFPQCNDNFFNPLAEICDEGGSTETCDADCTEPRCGDRFINPARDEECDQGDVANAICDLDCTFPQCNDGQFNPVAGEEADPPSSSSQSVPVNDLTCRYDFSGINQLYCLGGCGNWDGVDGCGQGDANALCKLKTGNPNSTAISFDRGESEIAPGICCPPPLLEDPSVLGCVALDRFDNRGVPLRVAVHDSNLNASHGPDEVVKNVVCTNP